MKKSFVFTSIFIVIIFLTVMVVPVLAANPSLSVGTVTIYKDFPNNRVTVTVPYTAANLKYITVLATKSSSNSSAPVASNSNTVYAKQIYATSGSSTLTFVVPYDEFPEEVPYCWIKLGGTSLSTPPNAVCIEIFDILQKKIVSGGSEISVEDELDCGNTNYILNANQELTIDDFSVKNANIDATASGSKIIMDGTEITGLVKFDGDGRVYTSAGNVYPDNVLHLMKGSSVGFIIAKHISGKSVHKIELTANDDNSKIVAFDVAGLNGDIIFGITICNIPGGSTVELTDDDYTD